MIIYFILIGSGLDEERIDGQFEGLSTSLLFDLLQSTHMNLHADNFGVTPPPSSLKSLTGIAFDQIRADILLGQLRPDERLRITNLTERYSVGATAVREALSRLVADDLVVAEDQRGFCVAPVSKADLLDLTQTRVDIEGLAVSRAIEVGDVEWESSVVSAFHRLSRCAPPTDDGGPLHRQWGLAHRQFHESLLAGCKSPWLMRITRLLFDKSERYRNLAGNNTQPNQRDIAAEHKALMDAALGRDTATAQRLISDHFWSTTNILLNAGLMTAGSSRRSPTSSTTA